VEAVWRWSGDGAGSARPGCCWNGASEQAGSTRSPTSRHRTCNGHWHLLLGQAWEELCRRGVPTIRGALARRGPWRPPSRYWHGADPEWDLVADAIEGGRVLVGEAWFSARPATANVLVREAERLARRPLPPVIGAREVVRALFVPAVVASAPKLVASVHIVTLADLERRSSAR
jgi:hypothetical protein